MLALRSFERVPLSLSPLQREGERENFSVPVHLLVQLSQPSHDLPLTLRENFRKLTRVAFDREKDEERSNSDQLTFVKSKIPTPKTLNAFPKVASIFRST